MSDEFHSLPKLPNSDQAQKETLDPKVASILNSSQTTNTSGQGKDSVVPPEIKGWCWGASFWGPIWAAHNKVWIGLLTIIPYAGLVVAIILGLKGKEWAWKAKRWDSVEHFNSVQRKWAIWGLVLYGMVIITIAIVAYTILSNPIIQDSFDVLNF